MKYRDVVRIIERDGWYRVRTRGSHMIYRHPEKSGTVIVSGGGKRNRDVPPGTLRDILHRAQLYDPRDEE